MAHCQSHLALMIPVHSVLLPGGDVLHLGETLVSPTAG